MSVHSRQGSGEPLASAAPPKDSSKPLARTYSVLVPLYKLEAKIGRLEIQIVLLITRQCSNSIT